MKTYEVGDITRDGFEVTHVNLRPEYTLRKRIQVTTNTIKNTKGKKGYFYLHAGYKWVELDNGNQYKLRESEFKYIDEKENSLK